MQCTCSHSSGILKSDFMSQSSGRILNIKELDLV